MTGNVVTMKQVKNWYRSARHQQGEEYKQPPLKQWIRSNAHRLKDRKLSPKLERVLLAS